MKKTFKKERESPAWQHSPADSDRKNTNAKTPGNTTIKTGGNSRAAEDDIDLDKHPYHNQSTNENAPVAGVETEWIDDFSEDPDEQSF